MAFARRGRRRPEITVVVPAYNVGPYLLECLSSVAEQPNFDAVEVIVVDDGSTDTTLGVARDAARRWTQIRAVHQSNRGPGAGGARNAGLRLASGQYVLFLDGDDLLAPGGLAVMHEAARNCDADLVVGRLEAFPNPKRYPWDDVFASLEEPVTAPIEDFPTLIHNPAPGNKLFRRVALQRLGLTFAEGIHHQDTYVAIPMMLRSDAITVVPPVVQRYRRRPGSVMDGHYTRLENFFDHLQVVEHLSQLRPRVSAVRRDVLDSFLVRSMQGFVLRAAELGERAPDFVARAGALYRDIHPEIFAKWTSGLPYRLAYAALRRQDLRGIAASSQPVRRVFAHEGRLYAGHWRGDGEPDALARTGRLIASLEFVRASGPIVTAGGTVQVRGLGPLDHVGDVSVLLRLRPNALEAEARVRARPDGMTSWVTSWNADEVATGSYRIRLVVRTPTGTVSAPAHPNADLEPVRAARRLWTVDAGSDSHPHMRVAEIVDD